MCVIAQGGSQDQINEVRECDNEIRENTLQINQIIKGSQGQWFQTHEGTYQRKVSRHWQVRGIKFSCPGRNLLNVFSSYLLKDIYRYERCQGGLLLPYCTRLPQRIREGLSDPWSHSLLICGGFLRKKLEMYLKIKFWK